MIIISFNESGICCQHVVPSTSQREKQTISSEYYCAILKTLFVHIAKKNMGIEEEIHPQPR